MDAMTRHRVATSRRNTWLFVIAMLAVLATLDAMSVGAHRAERLREVATESANLARSFADHAGSAFHLADAVLLEFRDYAERGGLRGGANAQANTLLANRVAALTLLRFVFITDADGVVVASSAELPPAGISIAGRDYFETLRRLPDRDPVFGTLDRSRLDKSWSVRIARRIDHPDGRFAGAVVATVDLDFFQRYYRNFDVGRHGSILLMTTQGRLMAREPFVESAIGGLRPDAPLIRAYDPRSPAGDIEQVSSIDGTRRLLSYRRLDDFPLLVAVARSTNESLAPWRHEAYAHLIGVGAIIVVTGVFGFRLADQIRARERVEDERERLAAEHRLLTENATDLVIRLGPDLIQLYASPSSRQLMGYAPAELVGRTPEFTTCAEEWPETERFFRALMEPCGPDRATFEYRGRRRDGATIWLEASAKRIAGAGGLVVACRDISPRKQVEARLEALTRQDALTGLTNRRAFDDWLEREFRRSTRNPSMTALIMVDVDKFKDFNDAHGHQGGDECLRAVAATLIAAARRPGDLAARYGGEEMALLLSATDIAGAMVVAEAVRAAVESLGIAHPRGPAGVVTISLGVAAVFAGAGAARADDLVKAADAALYAAKRAGRNTVRAAPGVFAAAA